MKGIPLMHELKKTAISKAILDSYHRKWPRPIAGGLGLWVTGMAVCATFGGPRMRPVFGSMLVSAKRVAELILETT